MDRLTTEQRHKNMSNIHNKDTSVELVLRKRLWREGFRFRKNDKRLPGKPDIVLPKYKTVIFVDGEFWHGKDFEQLKEQLQNSERSQFWIDKISKNIVRDGEINKQLKDLGWNVIRLWGKDVLKHTDECIELIRTSINGGNLQ